MSKIILESKVLHDNYTEYVCEKFDLQKKDISVTEIPMIKENELDTFDWNIGLICGNSGSGKSTILKHLGEIITPLYNNDKSIVSQFTDLSENEVTDLLSSVGLSSVPVWLHKPNELSNGEKARLDVCWILANSLKNHKIAFIDEFTSVVNRDCAKSLSFALQRYVRQNNIKIILSSCHFDIIEWLKPDWIFNLNKQNNGESEIERILYKDNEDYQVYKQINDDEILTKEYKL